MTQDEIWNPLAVEDVVHLMAGVGVPWWVAGGWAIDLFVGRKTRDHGDMDILIKRDDQLAVQEHLTSRGLLLFKTQQPGLKPWQRGEYIARPVDDIWCQWSDNTPWVLQLMLLCTQGDQWVFKRDLAIGGPLDELGDSTPSGVPYLRPHIQLLYKAKQETLAKDQVDLDVALPQMRRKDRAWLLRQLERRFSGGHPWIGQLKDTLSNERIDRQ